MVGPSVTAEDARSRMAEVLDLVHAQGKRVTITYRGNALAVVLTVADLKRLKELEKTTRRWGRSSAR